MQASAETKIERKFSYDSFTPSKISDPERIDLTHEPPFLAIDGPNAHEIDDAIRINRLKTGGFLIQTAIADGSKLAQKFNRHHVAKAIKKRENEYRGKVVTKKVLSEAVTSEVGLKDGINDAMIIRKRLNEYGEEISDDEIFPGRVKVIRSTYQNFGQACLDFDRPGYLPYSYMEFYRNFREWHGLKEKTSEKIAKRDGPEGLGIRIVASSMILANIAVANWAQDREVPILYREFDPNECDPRTLYHPYAQYVANPQPHYGIPGFGSGVLYTHATSPLRRAADLVNHLQIGYFLSVGQPRYAKEQMDKISDSLSPETKIPAMAA